MHVKMYGLKDLLCDSLCQSTASVMRSIFFLLSFLFLFLNFILLYLEERRLQGQKVDVKGLENESDADACKL